MPEDVFGLMFERSTGKMFKPDPRADDRVWPEDYIDTGYTFEDARQMSFGMAINLSPIGFATEATAKSIAEYVRFLLPDAEVSVEASEHDPAGGSRNVIERQIRVSRQGRSSRHNAGLIANAIIRGGSAEVGHVILADIMKALGEEEE